ncbi:MAG TPA: 16S rRNA (uracil(1498)-N(3))-methyltransferase [Candidatus Binatia bacterium]|nr:16S rRNA (uracil(1498)-N(3))-methyltransferase [Candidatus Binatia bacterium]
MNLILLFDEDFIDNDRVRLGGRRARHVRAVHGAQIGDELRVGRLNAKLGRGVVTALTDDSVEMTVTLDRPPPAPLPVAVLLALPRPKSLKRVLHAVATMGVKRVVLLNTWRVEKSFWNSPLLQPDALSEPLILGLEQARDTVLPEVTLRRRFKPFVEDESAALSAGTRKLLAHPAATSPCPHNVDCAVTLAIGPEGGFIGYEIELLTSYGFEPVSLGDRPLRVEQAVPALLGRLF